MRDAGVGHTLKVVRPDPRTLPDQEDRGVTVAQPGGDAGRVPEGAIAGSRLVAPAALGCVLVAFSAASSPAPAGGQTLSGLVLERGTDRPVVMARISLLGAGDSVMAQTLSDASGGFSLSSQEAGAFLLHTKALGYRESRAGIFELGPGGEMTLQIRLVPEPLEIEGLTVSREVALPKLVASGFLERFVGGLGHFLTPADLERGTGRLLIDRLGKLPGVRVVHGTVSLFNRARPCTPPIYLDGALALVQGDVEMLVGLEDVEAVEVYQGVTETPPQFGGMHSEVCGAIVIWTKRRD